MDEILNQILSELQQLKIGQDKTNEEIQQLKIAQNNTNGEIQHLKVATDARLEKIEQTMVTKQDIEILMAEQQKDIMSILTVTYNQIDEKLNTINLDITDIKEALNKVEFVTASNWKDITKLKSIK